VPGPNGSPRLDIALLSPCFWPEVRRGTERFVRDLADGLIANGHGPSLITSHRGPPSRRVEHGLKVLRLPRPPHRRLDRRRYPPHITHAPGSYLALRHGSYDIAHAVYPVDALAAARWRRQTGHPAVLSYMGIPDRRGLVEFRRYLDIFLRAIEGCDAVVVLSDHAAEACRNWLGHQPRVIPPGIELEVFRPSEARAARPTIVCGAAPEVPRKNISLLVEAFALVRRELPDARLVLSRPRDFGAVRKAGIGPQASGVEWAVLDDSHALARAYSEAWVAVLPSVNEAFGLVLVEALACGTPVVGYADGGIPEVVDRPGIGLLFDNLSADALASAILEAMELCHQPDTVTRCRARAEEFSLERCTAAYLGLYGELLGVPGVRETAREVPAVGL